jgi:hypothetical protein
MIEIKTGAIYLYMLRGFPTIAVGHNNCLLFPGEPYALHSASLDHELLTELAPNLTVLVEKLSPPPF